MKINIDELEIFLKVLILKSKISGFEEIEIDNDYYWDILTEESFNFNINPEIAVGSLSDDYECLVNMITKDSTSPVDFERLGNLLLAVAHSIESSNRPFLGGSLY